MVNTSFIFQQNLTVYNCFNHSKFCCNFSLQYTHFAKYQKG